MKMPRYTTEAERNFILGLYSSGESVAAIVARPDVSVCERTVKRWVNRFDEGGFEGLKTKPKSGRNKVTTPQQDEQIVNQVIAAPLTPAVSTVRDALPDVNISKATVYRR